MSESTAPGIREHRDNRGVFVELWVLDLLDGDYPTAMLFSQLLWWHQPAKDGRARVRFHRDGWGWLLRSDDEWQDECRLTVKQVRRARAVLASKGLIEHRRFKRDGAPTSAWRPRYEMFEAKSVLIRPNPELPSEGQFHGSTPQGAVGSDPGGAVPSVLSTNEVDTAKTPSAFERFWAVYPVHKSRPAAERAWAKAIKTTEPEVIIGAAQRYVDECDTHGRIVAYPASWLNAGRWTDEPLPAPKPSNGFHRPDPPKPTYHETFNGFEWEKSR